MTTENSTSAETATIDLTTADLLVVGSAIPPEEFEAVLANLAEAFPDCGTTAARSQCARKSAHH